MRGVFEVKKEIPVQADMRAPRADTDCPSFVEENATACPAERDPALREKNPRICKLKQCGKMPGCFVRRGGLGMTDLKVV
jgi:hypothetical protein